MKEIICKTRRYLSVPQTHTILHVLSLLIKVQYIIRFLHPYRGNNKDIKRFYLFQSNYKGIPVQYRILI